MLYSRSEAITLLSYQQTHHNAEALMMLMVTTERLYYWAPEDYYNFAKAFLRTKPLTDAFLKPQFGGTY